MLDSRLEALRERTLSGYYHKFRTQTLDFDKLKQECDALPLYAAPAHFFGRIVELRLALGNLAPIHADPAYWSFGETNENVARHMMAMMPAVPMISMDLTRLTDTEKQIIRYYVGMYNAHRELINKGEWKFIFGLSDIQAAIVENAKERMIIICDHGRFGECLKNDGKPTYVMNLSAKTLPYKCENAVDAACNPADGSCIPLAGSAVIK